MGFPNHWIGLLYEMTFPFESQMRGPYFWFSPLGPQSPPGPGDGSCEKLPVPTILWDFLLKMNDLGQEAPSTSYPMEESDFDH